MRCSGELYPLVMNDDFHYIAAIAEYGSISQAARAMHISQPGLSQRLKRLEAQLGTTLFDRTSIPLKPTESGKIYIKYAQRFLAAEESMRREVFSVADRRRERLRIGVSAARANALLAQPIVSFYESHKGCTVELFEMSTFDHMHKLFLDAEINFAVLTPIAPDPNAYTMEVLCHERLQVIASREFRVPALSQAVGNKAFLRQLEGVPFVLPACGQYFDPLISRIIDSSNAHLDIVVRGCSAELALGLVRNGLGVSVVPSTWILGMQDLLSYELSDITSGNVLRYIRRSDHVASSEEVLFLSILRSWLKEIGAA